MPNVRLTLTLPFILAAFAATSTPATVSAASAETNKQLRTAVDRPLRRAGVSKECIESLDTNQLTLVRTLTQKSPRNSREVLLQRQQLRTFVSRFCPTL